LLVFSVKPKKYYKCFNIFSYMSKAAVFVSAFLVLFFVTLAIPTLPPGDIIIGLFIIPTTEIVLGITIGTVLNSVVNGFIWGLIVFLVYVAINPGPKKREIEPLRASSYPTVSKPIPTEATSAIAISREPQEKRPLQVKKRRTYTSLDQDVETIEGIGPVYGSKLRSSGVRVVDDLLRAGLTRRKRRILASEIGVAPATMLKWVIRADFFRIKGIGAQYSSLLESAGVTTVTDLARRNPKNLYASLKAINRKKNLVRRIPPYTTIKRWIECADTLSHIIEY
jgi:predicted flap endonuclease-1-like 5' DNA nuclease